MTREEAIKTLKENICAQCPYGSKMENCDIRYCDNQDAIKALEQEPCDDCISRQAVLDMATTIQTDDFSGNEIIEVVEVDDVKALPPVIPQTKTECSCEQIKWERDTAIAQLKELGYGLGEKPKTDVLDKVRAEIEEHAYPIVHGVNNHERGMTLYGILQVIDKYKAESEGKE